MTAPFTLRPVVPEDALAIIDAHRDAVRGTAVASYSHEIVEEWAPNDVSPERLQGFARAIASGEEIAVGAIDSTGIVIGFGSIVPKYNELRAVYVRSRYGRRGVGQSILRRLEELARNAGLKELSMDASVNAESFYNAHGFVSEKCGEHVMGSG